MKSVVGVDPDGTRLERVRNLESSVEVGGVHGSRETVGAGVANLDNIGLGLEFGDSADGAEDLFLLDLHVLGNVGEDGRLNEVALVTLTLATSLDCGTRLLTLLNIASNVSALYDNYCAGQSLPHDAVKLEL